MAAPTFVSVREPTSNWGSTASGATRTTASFNVTAGDVLVVVAAAESAAYTATTPTGGSLTWTSVKAAAGTSANQVQIQSWTATASSTTSITFSLTAGGVANPRSWGFILYQFSGSGGVGASAITEQASGSVTATQALTTTQANSAIVVISSDWNSVDGTTRTWTTINSITPTSGNGLEKTYSRDPLTYATYTAYWNDVAATGSKTAGVSAPSGQRNSIIAIEVKGSAGSTSPVAKLIMLSQARNRASYW